MLENYPKILFLLFTIMCQLLNKYKIVCSSETTTNSSSLELILLHTNDMHARFEETGVHSNVCKPEDSLANQCYGGFARIATV